MVESSKILTVSYGTFSCTLEGFDDSFGTMKAIAEYFRDLAQGDRYFGAEPPAPDAEMLTRIAEKEIARRVEARADDSGIVLRAVEAEQGPAMPPVATPPSVEEVAAAAPEIDHDASESTAPATAVTDGDVAGPEAGEDPSPTLVASRPAAPIAAEDTVEEMDVAAPATAFAEMETSQAADVPAHPDADSVAAKLQRIRAVVSTGVPIQNDDVLEGDLTEDLSTEESAASKEVAEDAENDGEATPEVTEDRASAAASEDATDAVSVSAEDEVEVAEIEDTAEADAETLATEEVEAEVAEDETEEGATEIAAERDVAEAEVAESEVEAEAAVAETVEDAGAPEAETGTDEPKQNFRARILRVAKKSAATRVLPVTPEITDESAAETAAVVRESISAQMGEDAIVETPAEDTAAYSDVDEADTAQLADFEGLTEGTLSDADEAELMADLAEVEQEIEETAPAAPSGRDILPEADDAAMSRIMEEADEQLSEPAGSRRRSAIAQLKAAVAATEAARQLGDKGDDAAAKETAFRDDLNEAVRPRSRSELPRTVSRTERPRPAPLKLVPAQRVDEETGEEIAEAAPVQPRRVASEAIIAEAGTFADFAAEMGATELPDLLEAAAAYTAYVEGVEDFSRPQIMKKVQASASEEFSREDGLRSFGTLLRQGRISKVRNGRFQVSDQTRFKPEKKAG